MIAVDTNVLVYAEGIGDAPRIARAQDVLDGIPNRDVVFPVQALAELAHVLARKTPLASSDIRMRIDRWMLQGTLAPTMESTLQIALSLSAEHRFQVFDAIVLAASAEAGCRMLLTEDMQDGFVWQGVTVVNPFAETVHPLLADLMASGGRSGHDRPGSPDNGGGSS